MKKNTIITLVPIVTFFIGFFSFALLSIYYKVFFIHSEYDVPLLLNFSVMIGDSILLPIINYKIFKLYFKELSLGKPNKNLLLWILTSLLISLVINIYAHNAWVHDKYSDFVSTKQGEYLLTGYWHLVFSIIEMVILFIYLYLWVQSIKKINLKAIKYCKFIWIFFFIFTLMSIIDMLNKYMFVYNSTLSQTIKNEGFPFITSILAILILLIMLFLEKKATQNKA